MTFDQDEREGKFLKGQKDARKNFNKRLQDEKEDD